MSRTTVRRGYRPRIYLHPGLRARGLRRRKNQVQARDRMALLRPPPEESDRRAVTTHPAWDNRVVCCTRRQGRHHPRPLSRAVRRTGIQLSSAIDLTTASATTFYVELNGQRNPRKSRQGRWKMQLPRVCRTQNAAM